jgi:hypothetical protein
MTVDYIPFATGGGASVLPQATYVTEAPTGVVPGLADPTYANKAWRQSSMISAAVANFIASTLGISVLDDGNLTTLITNLTAALELAASSGIAVGMNAPTNLSFQVAEGSNNLEIAMKGTNGSDPSATNPVTIPFRDPTIANGEIIVRTITAPLGFIINSGNTMGVVNNNQPFNLWLFAIDNAGTIGLGAILCSTTSQVFPINEDSPQTTQSGTNGGSTAGLYYANISAVASKSIRILGRIEFGNGLANVGVWATAFTKIQLFGPGQRKPGDVVQSLYCSTTTATPSNGATKVNLSGFSPTPAITLTSSANLIRAKLTGNCTNGINAPGTINLFRGTNATVIGTTHGSGNASTSILSPVTCEAVDLPGTVGPVTYGAYVLASTTTMVWLNAAGIGVGGTGILTLEEIIG